MSASNLLTRDEIADRLSITPRAVDELRKARRIPAVKLSRKLIRYNWSHVEAAYSALETKAVATGKRKGHS
jgi:hypothetical protein